MKQLALALWLAATPIRLEEVREISRRNTQALLAELDHARAVQSVVGVRSALLPQLSFSAGIGRTYNSPQRLFATVPDTAPGSPGYVQTVVETPANQQDAYSFGFTLNQLLIDGTRWAQLTQAGALAEAAAGQARELQLSSELEGIRRFYLLFKAQRSKLILSSVVQRSEEQLGRSIALLNAGRIGRGDALAAQVNLGNDRINVVRQDFAIAGAQGDLSIWVLGSGLEDLEAQDPKTLDGALHPPSLEEAVSIAQSHRAILIALAAQVRGAQAGIAAAHAEFYPRLSARGTFLRAGPSPDFVYGDWRRQYSVAATLGLTWNIFDGLNSVSDVKTADTNLSTAQLTLAQTRREVERDVRNNLVALRSLILEAQLARENQEAASAGLKVAEERFRGGAATTLDVRDAQVKLAQAELLLLEASVNVQVTWAALERVMGTLN